MFLESMKIHAKGVKIHVGMNVGVKIHVGGVKFLESLNFLER